MSAVDESVDRRQAIAEAVWRLAVRGGLEQVSMRKVASEAGLSTRLVQYYFGTRDALLVEALTMRRAHDRVRIAGTLRSDGTARQRLRSTVMALLPIDADGRDAYLINVAYFVRSLSTPELVRLFAADDRSLAELFARQLDEAVESGELRGGGDTAAEAELLIALQDGMSSRLLLGMWSAADAAAMVDRHLDRLFGGLANDPQGLAPSSSR